MSPELNLKMFLRYHSFVSVLILFLAIPEPQSVGAEPGDANTVVAIVNGVKIRHKDIRVDRRLVQLGLRGEIDASELDREVRKHEIRRLAAKIRAVVFRQKVAGLRLTASEKEVDLRVEKIFQKAGVTKEKADAICKRGRALYEALVAWQKNPYRGEGIYNEKLADSLITRKQWTLFQLCYDTPEKLKRLRVPNNIDDMKKNSRKSSRRDVLYNKLIKFITKTISVSNQEIEQEYQKRYGPLVKKPPLEKVEDRLALELLAKKQQHAVRVWWEDQYRQAKIEIKSSRLKGTLDILLSPDPLWP